MGIFSNESGVANIVTQIKFLHGNLDNGGYIIVRKGYTGILENQMESEMVTP